MPDATSAGPSTRRLSADDQVERHARTAVDVVAELIGLSSLDMRALRGTALGIALAGLTLLGIPVIRAAEPQLVATLTPIQVDPAVPPITGSGSVRIFLGSDPGIICFELRVSNLPDFPPTFGGPQFHLQIFRTSGVAASVPNTNPINKALTTGCISGLSASLISDLFTNPQRYSAEVQELNPDAAGCGGFPSTPCILGAILGQLGFAPSQVPNAAMPRTAPNPAPEAATLVGALLLLASLIMAGRLTRLRKEVRG